MKKIKGLLFMLAGLVLLASTACAGKCGTAVIESVSATKVHLRAGASIQSDSLGLYFNGTQVDCLSRTDREWVEVEIGQERGYIKGSLLRTGWAADQVTPAWPVGYTTAKNYARLRIGPSKEYQMLCEVHPQDPITVFGETRDHWYYAEVNGETGYISSKLVRLSDDKAPSAAVSGQKNWASAYLNSLNRLEGTDWATCSLIYVNSDDIPELAVNSGSEAGGCQIFTYSNGTVDMLQTSRLDFTYIPREDVLCNAAGHMGYYYDYVYAIQDGHWLQIAAGEYQGIDYWDEVTQRYRCFDYTWNGRKTTETEYLNALHQVYDEYRGVSPKWEYSVREMKQLLTNMR